MTTSAPNSITITQDGAEREIRISYGLVNELVKIIESPEAVALMTLDVEIRGKCLCAILAERKPSGKIVTAIADPDDIDVSLTDVESLLHWGAEHVMGFFVRSLTQVANLTAKHEKDMSPLVSSLGGQTA